MSTIKNILLKVLGPIILSKSRIVETNKLGDHFMLLKIKGKSLKKGNWTPGQKVTVQITDKDMRSYTPTKWDKEDASFETLVYLHNNGPLSKWASSVKLKSKVTIMGPRASLVIDESLASFIFFGDETTFGLCYALQNGHTNISQKYFLESTHFEESQKVIDHLKLQNVEHHNIDNIDQIKQDILTHFNSIKGPKKIILSGKQQNIVKIRTFLFENNVDPKDVIIKVYWGWKDDPNGKLSK